MPQTGLTDESRKFLVAAFVAFIAMSAMATTPAHAQSDELTVTVFTDGDEQPVTWPKFSDDVNDPCPPPPINSPGWVPVYVPTATAVVSAPLPQAVATGLCMLGGNWFAMRLWKKRKI